MYPPFTEEAMCVTVDTYSSLYLKYLLLPCSCTKLFAIRYHHIFMEDLPCTIRNDLITYQKINELIEDKNCFISLCILNTQTNVLKTYLVPITCPECRYYIFLLKVPEFMVISHTLLGLGNLQEGFKSFSLVLEQFQYMNKW